TQGGAAPAAAALLVGCAILLGSENASHALSHPEPAKTPAVAESVHQDIRLDDKFAFANAKIRWRAEKGDLLPLLFEPAVLTKISYPTNALKLLQSATIKGLENTSSTNPAVAQQLIARKNGVFEINLQYQVHVTKREPETGFVLPLQYGLVNQL